MDTETETNASLKTGETITIFFKENDTAAPRVLCDGFPKNVATTFSTKWRAEFPPLNQINIDGLQQAAAKKSITIVGGNIEMYKDIVNWMLVSCNGKGIVQLRCPDHKPFTYLYVLRRAAAQIGCELLVRESTRRMEHISAMQIHSEDVRALWLLNPPDSEMKQILAEHVAIRLWEQRLKAKSAYWTLREEIPEFNDAINKILGVKKAEKVKARKEAPGVGHGGRRRSGPKRHWSEANHGHEEAATTKLVTLQAEVVRRASKGRPAFAKLDLGALGVTKEQFCG